MNDSRHYPDFDSAVSARIDEIMDTFDFRRVADTMAALDWQWFPDTTPPLESQIRREARTRLQRTAKSKAGGYGGGLLTEWTEGSENGIPWFRLELSFVLADSWTDGVSYGETGGEP